MIDVTALAESYFRSLRLAEELPQLKQAIIDAFEQGYVAHKHESGFAAPDLVERYFDPKLMGKRS